jgi:hypothetical protein
LVKSITQCGEMNAILRTERFIIEYA